MKMSLPPYPNPENDPVDSQCGRDWPMLIANLTIRTIIVGVCSVIVFVFGIVFTAGQVMQLFGR